MVEIEITTACFFSRNSIQSSYPESFHVYTVWIGARDTNIQVLQGGGVICKLVLLEDL